MKRFRWMVCACSAVLVFLVVLLLFFSLSFAPFGTESLAWMDANIQYLDFFAYFKDVLSGKNDLSYTFGKVLGGTNIAVFSYYLSSPFNLLVLLFDKAQLHSFFDLVVALKLAAAAAVFSYYLCVRFGLVGERRGECLLVIMLACGYALGHYPIAQSSNIMWLDGVYMLPLILTAVYDVVCGRPGWRLSVFVGLSILFNWYSGGINCMFSIFYMGFELILAQTDKPLTPVCGMVKDNARIVFRYGAFMALGVMISAGLFFPTIAALGNSSRGSLELFRLKDWSFFGDFGSVVYGLAPGVRSEKGVVSLFCGSGAVLGAIVCFASRRIDLRKKAVFAAMLLLVLLMFFFNPFVALFSLFKSCYSYWYRYSYVGIFFLLFLAGCGYFLSGLLQTKLVHSFGVGRRGLALGMLLLCVVIAELSYGSAKLMKRYRAYDVDAYEAYAAQAQAQIDEIKVIDDGFYRVSQTTTRNAGSDRLTANYNEALAFNYASISGYTSSADEIQKQMLGRMGYRINCENMNIVNTSLLAVDSLLGVKYVISDYPINGLELVEGIPSYNGKRVYRNPYALDFAYLIDQTCSKISYLGDPFLYVNELYSQLLGEPAQVYIPVAFSVADEGDLSTGAPRVYELSVPDGEYAVYGNIQWQSDMNAMLTVGEYRTGYSCWLSPSVFYVPTQADQGSVTVQMKAASGYSIEDEQFYALDLACLKKATDRLKSAPAMDETQIENGRVRVRVYADAEQKLMLSVPHDRAWKIKRNGEAVTPDLFAGCMYVVDLCDGENTVELVYHPRYLTVGIAVSLLGLAMTLLMMVKNRKRIKA